MSIYRISSNTMHNNGIHNLKDRQHEMDRVDTSMSSGRKYRTPRENPVDIAQSLTYHTKIVNIDQYIRNINDAEGERSLAEVKIMDTINILQRARELAVQGSNGIYKEEERKAMAMEIDQILRNVVMDANSKYKNNFLFSGFKKYTKPFEILEGAVRGINEPMITEVRYLGDNGKQLREIDNSEYVAVSKPGSEVFWSEQFQIYSSVNTADFRMTEDTSILIDGTKISFNAGDNIYAITEKINRSPAAVKASLDIVTGGLIIKTTVPHKMELADIEGGTLLQDLGILEEGRPIGPDNYNGTATVFDGSVFDALIGLRNAMLDNNAEDIGGRYLGALDNTLDNLSYNIAELGALSNRMSNTSDRLMIDKESYTETMSKLVDVDVAEAISRLKLLDFAHKASLSSLAKLTKTTLMDFLR